MLWNLRGKKKIGPFFIAVAEEGKGKESPFKKKEGEDACRSVSDCPASF